MDDNKTRGGLGLSGITLLWALVTQCLSWGGVISWPWIVIWGPFLLSVTIAVVLLVLAIILLIIAG